MCIIPRDYIIVIVRSEHGDWVDIETDNYYELSCKYANRKIDLRS